jgi:hydrogenase maturation protein HypF
MRTEGKSYRLTLEGLVQGVGLRPFLYQQATRRQLRGWVMNTGRGLSLELFAVTQAQLDEWLCTMHADLPQGAVLQGLQVEEIAEEACVGFSIRESQSVEIATRIPLDVAPCSACSQELFDPASRRYQYPFISCSRCGPRYTILHDLPFDRRHTSFRDFPLCSACQREYADPGDRRFHAQTISCPDCGPVLTLLHPWGARGRSGGETVAEAAKLLKQGSILAIKGIGGYQLAALASDSDAVARLRLRKRRPEKPLALMFPGIDAIRRCCHTEAQEESMLQDPAAPIVLLRARMSTPLSPLIRLDLPLLGAMLPSSPLHVLLLQEVQEALVMTSANLPGAPMLITDDVGPLQDLADGVLRHNRFIAHRADDSVVRCMNGRRVALRLGRGLAPYTVQGKKAQGMGMALGGDEKNTFALQKDACITVSPHMGHLSSPASSEAWEQEITALRRILRITPQWARHDAHPDYYATQQASVMAPRTQAIPHHEAHVYACLAEHPVQERALALAWDGAGLGSDGSIWGGEGFIWNPDEEGLTHVASCWPFPLIGGDRVAREPRRSALGLALVLFPAAIDPLFLKPFVEFEARAMRFLLQDARRFPFTSSVARLFDAVASLLQLRQTCSFEGQAALLLEGLADAEESFEPFTMALHQQESGWIWDWRPMLLEILGAVRDAIPASLVATRFHQSLVAAVETLMQRLDVRNLLLSGGVFQNRFLVETFERRAAELGYRVWHAGAIPCNDAGLSLGQLMWTERKGR